MKDWIKRILGRGPSELDALDDHINSGVNALDDYVVVKRKELENLIDELNMLRNRGVLMKVTPKEFLHQVQGKEEMEGRPVFWTEWPTMNHRE